MSLKIAMLVMVAATLTMINGCAAPVTQWNHPYASEDKWAVDKANCRSRARRLSEKERVVENYTRSVGDDEFTSGYANNMMAYDSQRKRQETYESCLKKLGYTPAKPQK